MAILAEISENECIYDRHAHINSDNLCGQVAQLLQRDRAAGWVSLDRK